MGATRLEGLHQAGALPLLHPEAPQIGCCQMKDWLLCSRHWPIIIAV